MRNFSIALTLPSGLAVKKQELPREFRETRHENREKEPSSKNALFPSFLPFKKF